MSGRRPAKGGNRLKFHLILSLDYEVFGNGSGCLDACLRRPVEHCLRIVEGLGGHLDLFVDASEFLVMRRQAGRVGEDCRRIESQLVSAVENGHALQLHLHPQWSRAHREGDGWRLAMDRWRIGDLDGPLVESLVGEGIDYLNGLGARDLIAFRAGGWAVQPSSTVLRVLARAGIRIDSTVAPGCRNPAAGDWYDFSSAPDEAYWRILEDVCRKTAGGPLVEVPIVTHDVGWLSHLRALREHRSRPGLPEGCRGDYGGPNSRWQAWRGKAGKLMRMGRVMLDFSTVPAWLLIAITEGWMSRYRAAGGPVPIVAIAHGKNFTQWSARNLEHWLNWVRDREEVVLSSYGDWYRKWNEGGGIC